MYGDLIANNRVKYNALITVFTVMYDLVFIFTFLLPVYVAAVKLS